MSEDSIRDLAVVLATAIPVIVVAYYAAIPDMSDRTGGGDIFVPVGRWPWRWPSILRWWPVRWLLQTFGNAKADDVPKGQPTKLHVQRRFQIGTSKGFVIRSAIGFLVAVWPFVLVDRHPVAAQRTEAAALVLTVWNLQALIFYSSLVLALAWQTKPAAADHAEPEDAEPEDAADAWSLVIWAVGAFFLLLVATTALAIALCLA